MCTQCYIFDPLTPDEFKKRINENFPSAYLTLISIIQGVSLGILANNTFTYIKDPCLAEPWESFLPYSIMCFFLIIIVTYEYVWFIGVFHWSPKIWDTFIPFFLGISEIVPMFYLTSPKIWWLCTAGFSVCGAFGFYNSLRNCKEPMFCGNKKMYNRVRKTLKQDVILALAAAIICLFAVFSASKYMKVIHWYLPDILFLVSLTCIAIVLICKEEKFMRDLHEDLGFTY